MGQTVVGYPFPDYLDQPNGPLQLQSLGEAVEQDVILKYPDATSRDAVITNPQPGMLSYLTSTGQLMKFASGRWQAYWPKSPPTVSWTNMVLGTNWSAYGGAWEAPSYTKDALGWVRLRGLARNSGTDTAGRGTTVTTLPVGFRPTKKVGWLSLQSGSSDAAVFGRIEIGTDGTISWPSQYVPTVTSALMFLYNIRFEAA